mmetsp:Transcript_23884/g.66234  ORF Transcript_23884/g.66234 Transcript_23884/m.66234 type:complete len:313 (+) Transcript_23884:1289-2227(+)
MRLGELRLGLPRAWPLGPGLLPGLPPLGEARLTWIPDFGVDLPCEVAAAVGVEGAAAVVAAVEDGVDELAARLGDAGSRAVTGEPAATELLLMAESCSLFCMPTAFPSLSSSALALEKRWPSMQKYWRSGSGTVKLPEPPQGSYDCPSSSRAARLNSGTRPKLQSTEGSTPQIPAVSMAPGGVSVSFPSPASVWDVLILGSCLMKLPGEDMSTPAGAFPPPPTAAGGAEGASSSSPRFPELDSPMALSSLAPVPRRLLCGVDGAAGLVGGEATVTGCREGRPLAGTVCRLGGESTAAGRAPLEALPAGGCSP